MCWSEYRSRGDLLSYLLVSSTMYSLWWMQLWWTVGVDGVCVCVCVCVCVRARSVSLCACVPVTECKKSCRRRDLWPLIQTLVTSSFFLLRKSAHTMNTQTYWTLTKGSRNRNKINYYHKRLIINGWQVLHVVSPRQTIDCMWKQIYTGNCGNYNYNNECALANASRRFRSSVIV